MDTDNKKDQDKEEEKGPGTTKENPTSTSSRLLNRIEDISSEITQDAVATTSKLTDKLTSVMKNIAERFSPSTSNENPIAVPSASTSSPREEMKKRSSQSLRRNYRRSLPQDKEAGSESDSDTERDVESEGKKSRKSDEELNLSDGIISSSNEGFQPESETSTTTTTNDDSSNDSHASYTLPETYAPDVIEEELEENDEPSSPNPRWASLTSSSSSSSCDLMNLNHEEDSSSSDSYLEDLEESVDERVPKLNNGGESDSNQEVRAKRLEKKKFDLPQVLQKPKPLSHWNGPKELFLREMGYRDRSQCQGAELFRSRFYGSLYSVERLELMKKLDGHRGCVNCLNFNYSGTKLMSGSDDLTIKIWNYGLGKEILSFNSGHRSNVFQAKFLPLGTDNMIVSCARDNQVRLTELDSTGKVFSSRRVASHKAPAHKLSISVENPHVVLSCGEDGVVFNIDIRKEKPDKILTLKENGNKIALYSISGHPLNHNEFCINGRDAYVRLYDMRKLQFNSGDDEPWPLLSESKDPIKKFCPQHLVGNENRPTLHVTSAVYNYNGKEILASYNDENVYLFDTSHSDMADCIKVYEGHRNSATVKGVNFFGDRSQFVISGSDCGHIFIWDKETEAIVNFFRGDENGVINCLEPHPLAPILATSGIDDDVKIWIPSNENSPKMGELASTVRKNLKKRNDDRNNFQADDHDIMNSIWNQLIRQRMQEEGSGSDDSNEYDDGEHVRERIDCVIA